ncbi:MAG: hypothetical protein V3V69_02975 [Nitrosopumilaceae archaeon]
MTLTDNFKKEAAFTLEGYISHLKRTNFKELLGVKKIGKYENYKDFWHGYFLGMIEGQLMQAFFHDFKRKMTQYERTELDQIISLYDIYLQDATKKLK